MQTQPSTIAAAIYARVSTEDQAERQTVQAQLDFLRKYCELHQTAIAGEYVDDGVSGTVPLGDRPEGRRLLDAAQAGRFGVVLVYRLDRLGRSLASLISAHDRLDDAGVAIRSATEPLTPPRRSGNSCFNCSPRSRNWSGPPSPSAPAWGAIGWPKMASTPAA